MNGYKVELKIIGDENLEVILDYQTVHLMMLSEYVTIDGNTVRVSYKEVTSDGIVRFTGSKI
ncbi:hypothetical protein [Rummeliibacillus pycnus]|uniref:hypothetical protein n=1 Tax=Rummeliibacillus pycnus TaxID=101070 RepID=UPI0037CA770E